MKKIFTIILLTVFFWPGFTFSQTGGFISLEISPENPPPNSQVRAKIESFSTDLTRANISWSVNNRQIESGIGRTSITFTVGAAGQATTIYVRATDLAGKVYELSRTIRPAGVDLIWEARTYLPPYYRGRALPSSQSTVRIIAFPEIVVSGSRVSPNNLIYQWRRDGKPLQSESGYGRRSLEIIGPKLFGQSLIEVTASTRDGRVSAQGLTLVKAVDPQINFYLEEPLAGSVFERALGPNFEFEAGQDEVALRAEPFYFSREEKVSAKLILNWVLSGQKVTGSPTDPYVLNLRREGGQGETTVGFSAKNPSRVLQEAVASLRVTFGNLINFSQ